MVNQRHQVISDDGGKIIRMVEDNTFYLWFYRFNTGLKYWMGNIWQPNKALSTELIIKVIKGSEKRRSESVSMRDKRRWMIFTAYVTWRMSSV